MFFMMIKVLMKMLIEMKITVKKKGACKYDFRCGFKIDEQRNERRVKLGVEGVLWLNMDCTGPWSGDTVDDNDGEDDCDLSYQPRMISVDCGDDQTPRRFHQRIQIQLMISHQV